MGPKAASLKAQLAVMPNVAPGAPDRVKSEYIGRLQKQILAKI